MTSGCQLCKLQTHEEVTNKITNNREEFSVVTITGIYATFSIILYIVALINSILKTLNENISFDVKNPGAPAVN